MDGIAVSPAALTAAATSAAVVAAGIDGAPVAKALERLAAVLPGSATASAAGALAERWDTAHRALAGAVAAQAGHLAGSASDYDLVEIFVAAGPGVAG